MKKINPMTVGYRVINFALWITSIIVVMVFVEFWWQQVMFLGMMLLVSFINAQVYVSAIKDDVMDLVKSSEEMLASSKATIASLENQVAELTAKQS